MMAKHDPHERGDRQAVANAVMEFRRARALLTSSGIGFGSAEGRRSTPPAATRARRAELIEQAMRRIQQH